MPLRNHYHYPLVSLLAAGVLVCGAFFVHLARDKHVARNTTSASISVRSSIAEPKAIAKLQLSSPSAPAPEIASDPSITTATAAGNSDREILTQQLQKIEADYVAIAQPIYDQSSPLIQKDDRAKLAFLENEKLADLSKVLAPAELEIYQNSPAPDSAPRRR